MEVPPWKTICGRFRFDAFGVLSPWRQLANLIAQLASLNLLSQSGAGNANNVHQVTISK